MRIGAPEGFGSYFLAPRLGALCDRHPDLEVELVAMGAVFSLSKREADIAVSLTRPEQGRLFSRRLTDYRLGLYASKTYFDTHPEIARIADLKRHRIIGYIEDLIFSSELSNMFAQAEVPQPRLRSSNLIAQMKAAVSGAGLCMLPAFIAGNHAQLQPVLAQELAVRRTFWLTVHADLRDLARVRETAGFIDEEVRATAISSCEGRLDQVSAPSCRGSDRSRTTCYRSHSRHRLRNSRGDRAGISRACRDTHPACYRDWASKSDSLG